MKDMFYLFGIVVAVFGFMAVGDCVMAWLVRVIPGFAKWLDSLPINHNEDT